MKELNQMLSSIIVARLTLNKISYNDSKYDEIEELLHDLEDDLLDKFGSDLDKVLADVYKKHNFESEVLSPLAYIGKKYISKGKNKDGSEQYDVENNQEGIAIDDDTTLVFLPNPIRLVMLKSNQTRAELWNSKEKS